MEKFKKKINRRILLLAALLLIGVAMSIYDVFFASEELKNSYYWGLQAGSLTGLQLVAVFAIIRLSIIRRDETKLREQYNKENDERLKAIRAKAGMPILMITSLGMFVTAIVAGYFNDTVFFTLIIAAAAQLLIGAVIKVVNLKRM